VQKRNRWVTNSSLSNPQHEFPKRRPRGQERRIPIVINGTLRQLAFPSQLEKCRRAFKHSLARQTDAGGRRARSQQARCKGSRCRIAPHSPGQKGTHVLHM
jgi:hypothetical protein